MFTELRAHADVRAHGLRATTRYRFTPGAIEARWTLRGLRAADGAVTFPSWGAGAHVVATLRDGLEQFTGRFAGLFVIRPAHNPLGPLDFAGVYDERSDRTQELSELVDRGYEDAYRQFIEPIVGAGGERMEVHQGNGATGKRGKA